MTGTDGRHDLSGDGARSRGSRRVVSDLVLGARLSVGGGRASWIRLGLMAFAVGMCVTLLLIGASVGRAGDARSERADLIQPRTIQDIGRSSYPSEQAREAAISAARFAVQYRPVALAGLALATLAIIALITATTLPALRRLTRPDALRTE